MADNSSGAATAAIAIIAIIAIIAAVFFVTQMNPSKEATPAPGNTGIEVDLGGGAGNLQ